LFGESGAGKRVAAELLHALSARTGPLVLRNAPTLTSGLVDAELFGNLKDYPNPGMPYRQGIIGAADGGYLLLDEIGNVGQGEQEHLLTVLDKNGEYHQLGNDQPMTSNFRLVGTTNRSMTSLKHDLAARCKHRIVVPGLNERRSDIPFLISRHLRQALQDKPDLMQRFSKNGELSMRWLAPAFVDALARHWYTHHTRELERYLDLSILKSRANYLEQSPEVAEAMAESTEDGRGNGTDEVPAASFSRPRQLPSVEEGRQALEDAGGNLSAAGRALGIHRDRLRRLLGLTSR
jgi:two-component system nitrogen regulation response regulator GlnG/two-component system response regulator HydG